MTTTTSSLPPTSSQHPPVCTVITPVYNAAPFLFESLNSILLQDVPLNTIQLVLFNDNSTDSSLQIASQFLPSLKPLHSVFIINSSEGPLGVGSARNRACQHATAPILIFHDADDIMHPSRVSNTLNAFTAEHVHVVGGTFDRFPFGSTPRYQRYHTRIQTHQLFAHTFRDAPLAMPTVACRKQVWDRINFREGTGIPEDLHFFYDCLEQNLHLEKIPHVLCTYRYHPAMTSLSLHRRALLSVRVRAFERLVLTLSRWQAGFSIWGCGRDGKDVFKNLSEVAQNLVTTWGEVNPRKIGNVLRGNPIVHFSKLRPPIACCVALDREDGEFEANLATLHLREGVDYVFLI